MVIFSLFFSRFSELGKLDHPNVECVNTSQLFLFLDMGKVDLGYVDSTPSEIGISILSQPNNNHNPNNKTTITLVGLKLSNRWKHHPPPPPQTQNYMIEQNSENKSY